MNIALVTNMNGIGLTRDYELLRDYLAHLGHVPTGVQFDGPIGDGELYDLAIFLEVAPRHMLQLSERRWLFANPEWCRAETIQVVQRNFEKVFAKTNYGFEKLKPFFPGKLFYTGFLTRDQYDSVIERRPWFLHIGGNSAIRGTQAVLDAWKWNCRGIRLDQPLFIVSSVLQERPDLPNVTIYDHVDELQLKELQNQCSFHIYPSGTEGWGHALHEAQSVGAQIITIGRPPMSELRKTFCIGDTGHTTFNLAEVWETSAFEIYKAVECVSQMSVADVAKQNTRNEFLKGNADFVEAFKQHLDAPAGPVQFRQKRKIMDPCRIGFLGNFVPPESTENQVKWALENRMGLEVEQLQENTFTLRRIEEAMDWCDIFLWIHTRGYLKISDFEMLNFIEELKKRKIPTVSMHLDKFWGIPAREEEIGFKPFWHTDYVHTSDGSRQLDFKARHVNHIWMPPAVSEVYCHPGTPREEHKCDVVFVGAKGYHEEYPFRPQMVEMLANEYGDRFKHVQGVRGHELNDVYASAKIVVGDCIFAGTPYYWSDRVPETCGRYGFLLHPQIEGMTIPMATYPAGDLSELRKLIEEWLRLRGAREEFKIMSAHHVLRTDTWEARLRSVFLDPIRTVMAQRR